MATPSTSNVSRGTAPGKAPAKSGGLKGTLTKKVGPLPLWVWGAGGIVIVGGILYLRSKSGSSTQTSTAGTPDASSTDTGGGSGGGGSGTSTGGGSGGGGTSQDYSGSGGGSGSASAGPSSPPATSTINPTPPPAPAVHTAYGLKPGTVVTPILPSGTGKQAVTSAAQTAEPTATGYGAPQVRAVSGQQAVKAAATKKAATKKAATKKNTSAKTLTVAPGVRASSKAFG